MPTPHDVRFFETPAQLRKWFQANHAKETELWLGYHLKRTGRPSVTWQDAVDQELCFGWIDSVRYSMDGGRTAQRLTPRRKGSVWSDVNVKRYRELEKMGLVHPAGRAAFEKRNVARSGIYSYEVGSRGLDAAAQAEFQKHKRAWEFFESQAPSYRRTIGWWVVSPKRDETRRRRLAKLIEHSQRGERVPPFVTPSRRVPRSAS
jgi:uncharacterized protein YdeI (YjbR/CyaY-like superfamily)